MSKAGAEISPDDPSPPGENLPSGLAPHRGFFIAAAVLLVAWIILLATLALRGAIVG